jgi:hypothetical protein
MIELVTLTGALLTLNVLTVYRYIVRERRITARLQRNARRTRPLTPPIAEVKPDPLSGAGKFWPGHVSVETDNSECHPALESETLDLRHIGTSRLPPDARFESR